MSNVKRLGVVAVALVMSAALAAPALAASDVTVGQFLQEFAKAKNLNATDPRIAADSLAVVGVQVPNDVQLSQRLTESVVIKISRSAGLNLSTSRPDASFSAEQVDRFFATFAGDTSASHTRSTALRGNELMNAWRRIGGSARHPGSKVACPQRR